MDAPRMFSVLPLRRLCLIYSDADQIVQGGSPPSVGQTNIAALNTSKLANHGAPKV